MKRLTNEELTQIKERAEKASGEEWVRLEDGTVIALTGDGIAFDLVVREVESYNHVNDEHFIAHAREDIPKLITGIEALRMENQRYRKALEEIRNYGTYELNDGMKAGYAWIAQKALEESE